MGSTVNENTLTKNMSSNEQWQEPTVNQSDAPIDGGSPQHGDCGRGCRCYGRG